jgi:hypothetical protein
MKKTWKPIAAGVLDIIGSIFSGFIAAGLLDIASCSGEGSHPPSLFAEAVAIVLLAIAYLALVGGFCAIQRRKWRLALAGSVAAFLYLPVGFVFVFLELLGRFFTHNLIWVALFCLGMGSAVTPIVLTALSKNEFE